MRLTKQLSPRAAFILSLFFCLVCLASFIFLANPAYQKATASEEWPHTEGTILISEVIRSERAGTRRQRKSSRTSYKPHIVYQYTIGDRAYRSSTIFIESHAFASSFSSDAYQTQSKYPEGAKVKVYYNPINQHEAVLERGVNRIHYLLLMFPLTFGLGGLLGILNAHKTTKRHRGCSPSDKYSKRVV